ncbi:hypothetical protein ABT150_23680 [Streptomyces mirabilis]|uniref:hypothetical protein n=1 Tax=Streptomyces mirabilis TaxID=68239 RepID=UPI003319DDEA
MMYMKTLCTVNVEGSAHPKTGGTMLGRKASEAADSASSAVFRAGRKIGGEKGGKAANVVTGALLGRTHEQCGDACGHCNAPHANGA